MNVVARQREGRTELSEAARASSQPSTTKERLVAAEMGKIRKWKSTWKGAAGSTTVDKGNKISLEKRLQMRAERAATQAAQRAVDDTIRQQKRAEREEREAREKRKKENKEKGLQYQVITNASKIKKMSKKQLRLIKKADTSGVAPKKYD